MTSAIPAFWDASALVPLCVPGQGGPALRRLLRQHPVVAWWGSAVEIASALCRLERGGRLDAAQAEIARTRAELLRRSWREVQPSAEIRQLALDQLRLYDLRAGDALQLAAALVWYGSRSARRVFLSCDLRLSRAAAQAGFRVITL